MKDVQILEHQKEAKAAKKEAAKHHKQSVALAETLEVQLATEEIRVEERAQQLAAEKIQAHLRKHRSQKKVFEMKKSRDELIKSDPNEAAKFSRMTSSDAYHFHIRNPFGHHSPRKSKDQMAEKDMRAV